MLVGYMRVSTLDERQSIDLQRDALICAGVDDRHLHQDRASGGRDDRPCETACIADLRAGDVLVVWKLDRLGRSLSHLIRIVEELKGRGVAFRSLTEAIDTTTAHGELLFNLFGSLARYERALISERVTAGLAAARRRGRKGGRTPTIDPERVERIVAALDDVASKASVCRSFKVPRSTLVDTLQRAGWTGAGVAGPKAKRPATKPRSPTVAAGDSDSRADPPRTTRPLPPALARAEPSRTLRSCWRTLPGYGRPHLARLRCLSDERWFVDAAKIWRDRRGRLAR